MLAWGVEKRLCLLFGGVWIQLTSNQHCHIAQDNTTTTPLGVLKLKFTRASKKFYEIGYVQ